MNASLSLRTSRVSGLVEQVSARADRPVAVVSVTPARRAGALSRFLKALVRSLSAFAA